MKQFKLLNKMIIALIDYINVLFNLVKDNISGKATLCEEILRLLVTSVLTEIKISYVRYYSWYHLILYVLSSILLRFLFIPIYLCAEINTPIPTPIASFESASPFMKAMRVQMFIECLDLSHKSPFPVYKPFPIFKPFTIIPNPNTYPWLPSLTYKYKYILPLSNPTISIPPLYKLPIESLIAPIKYMKTYIIPQTMLEMEESKVQYPGEPIKELTIQEEIEIRKEKCRMNIINMIKPLGLTINEYDKMPINVKTYIYELIDIQKDPLCIEINNMPSEQLYTKLNKMINGHPELIQAIQTNNWQEPTIIKTLAVVRKLAVNGNIVCQHYIANLFARATEHIGQQYGDYQESIIVYQRILEDLKSNK